MKYFVFKKNFTNKDYYFIDRESAKIYHSYDLVKNLVQPSSPLVYTAQEMTGPKINLIMPVADLAGNLLSQQALDIMNSASLKGWCGLQVKVVSENGANYPGSPYYLLQILNDIEGMEYGKEIVKVGKFDYTKGRILDMTGYNGSDIFSVKNKLHIFVTEKWKNVFEQHFPELFTFTPIEEVLDPV